MSNITVTPINNKVILKYIEDRQVTERDSGIAVITRETSSQRHPISTVLSVPDEICDDRGNYRPSKFQPGDRVIFNAANGSVIEVEGQRAIVVNYSDIFAVITEAP